MNERENTWIKLIRFQRKKRSLARQHLALTTILHFHIDAMLDTLFWSSTKDTTPNLGVNGPPQYTGSLKRQKQFLGFLVGLFMKTRQR